MTMRYRMMLIAAVVCFMAGWVSADTLVTKDGRTFEGRLVSDQGGTVVFEVVRFGATTTMRFDSRDLQSITKGPLTPAKPPVSPPATSPAKPPVTTVPKNDEPVPPPVITYSGPTYYVIPMKGKVGIDMKAAVLEKALADAVTRKPTVVVLDMDSPGGMISEVTPMVDLLDKYRKQVKIVVHAKNAISAAAITSLAVEDIYMKRGGMIGAALAYKTSAMTGMPEEIGEKMDSIWRATARSSAEIGNHPTIIAEAMVDNSVSIWKHKEGDKFTLRQNGDTRADELIKRSGKLLTLTAKEAVDIGLARAVVDDLDELGKHLGHDTWEECKGLGVPLVDYWIKKSATVQKQFEGHMKNMLEELETARLNDPSGQGGYLRSAQTGRLIPESARKWQEYTNRCVAAIMRAEQALAKAAALAQANPQIFPEEYVTRLKETQERIAKDRVRIKTSPQP